MDQSSVIALLIRETQCTYRSIVKNFLIACMAPLVSERVKEKGEGEAKAYFVGVRMRKRRLFFNNEQV
jgi:hypothetical protein